MPTIAKHLSIPISLPIQYEIDGVSLIGKVSVAQPQINIFQNTLDVSWQNFDEEGNVKIWMSMSNNFNTKGNDNYTFLGEFPVNQRNITIDISKYKNSFYKVVIDGKYNSVNKWFEKK